MDYSLEVRCTTLMVVHGVSCTLVVLPVETAGKALNLGEFLLKTTGLVLFTRMLLLF